LIVGLQILVPILEGLISMDIAYAMPGKATDNEALEREEQGPCLVKYAEVAP
jgi:hypothetical protein